MQVIKDSRLLGKTILDLDIRRKYGLNIMEVRVEMLRSTVF